MALPLLFLVVNFGESHLVRSRDVVALCGIQFLPLQRCVTCPCYGVLAHDSSSGSLPATLRFCLGQFFVVSINILVQAFYGARGA